jgi:hypothetical protein
MAKGGFIDVTTMVSSGLGAYAAKRSSSMGGLLWRLAKYALVVIGILIGVILVSNILAMGVETFVPVVPSAEQDKKYTTPAGNVITY